MVKFFISDNLDVINGQMNVNKHHDAINFINFQDVTHSQSYNPLFFIYEDSEIYELANYFYKELNLKCPASFFYLTSAIGYLINYRPANEQNLVSLNKIIKAAPPKNCNDIIILDCIINEVYRRYLKILDKKGYVTTFTIKNYEMFASFPEEERTNTIEELKKAFSMLNSVKYTNFFYDCDMEFMYDTVDDKTTYICMPKKDDMLYPYAKLFIKDCFSMFEIEPELSDIIFFNILVELDENMDESIKEYINSQNKSFVIKETKPVSFGSVDLINKFTTRNYLKEDNYIFEDEILDEINKEEDSNILLSNVKNLKDNLDKIKFEPMLKEEDE